MLVPRSRRAGAMPALLLLPLLLSFACGGSPPPARNVNAGLSAPENPDVALARELTQEFYSGDLEKLHARFTPEMGTEHLPLERLVELRAFVLERYGEERAVLEERWMTRGGYRGVVRRARFDKAEEPVEVRWGFKEERIAALEFKPTGSAAQVEIR